MIRYYVKKPVVVRAVQWTGLNFEEIKDFVKDSSLISKFCIPPSTTISLKIQTLEGEMEAKSGDYIIEGVKGEFYPCKPDIFEATYQDVTDMDKQIYVSTKVLKNNLNK